MQNAESPQFTLQLSALSESSLFISPHRLILKTCGTTLNLLGLPRILQIASTQANLPSVYRCFYSRKSFMFPERQLGPHRDWKHEVEYLDNIFQNGAAYTVGKFNGDHWLLYMTTPDQGFNCCGREPAPSSPISLKLEDGFSHAQDYTIEILMSDLSPSARQSFFSLSTSADSSVTPSSHAQAVSATVGISNIFPPHLTTLDAYTFSPCGYSSNALIKWGNDATITSTAKSIGIETSVAMPYTREGYYTIHVTPEEGWSYASFECNIPLPITSHPPLSHPSQNPDLKSVIQRVVDIFQPGRLSLTLFIQSKDNELEEGASAVEAAQRAFREALTPPSQVAVRGNGPPNESGSRLYKRTNKINYEFWGYDLAFASFELRV